MKLLYCLTTLLLFAINLSAQLRPVPDVQTETVIGAQLGLSGIAAYGELPLGYRTALRGEVGLNVGWSGGSARKTAFGLFPVFVLSPRWYYNIVRRAEKGRRTARNAANFFSLRTTANPGTILIGNDRRITVDRNLAIIPSWGIRRMWGKVSFETGLGVGYLRQSKDYVRRNVVTGDIYLRIGI